MERTLLSFDDLNIDSSLIKRFEHSNIRTIYDLYCYSPFELSLKFHLPLDTMNDLLEKIYVQFYIQPTTAYDLLIQTQNQNIPTNISTLDNCLKGGLRRKSLTELCGSWGSGKTPFSLYLCSQCSLAFKHTIYIDTERAFSAKRLLEIIISCSEQNHNKKLLNYDKKYYEKYLEYVRYECVSDMTQLMKLLNTIEQELQEKNDHDIILIIVDSIAAPLRASTPYYKRNQLLLEFTDLVKRLAENSNLVMFVTNQITTKRRSGVLIENDTSATPQPKTVKQTSNENSEIVFSQSLLISDIQQKLCEDDENMDNNEYYMGIALGKAWTYSVNLRLAISYDDAYNREQRRLIIGKSIDCPGYSIPFQITNRGIEEGETVVLNELKQEQHLHQNKKIKLLTPQLIVADNMQLVGKRII
ncbi:unnamed protein product [Didymodactylos carnosus]|uniref:RecA family profile 1 domain-containing protein n=2 Tax=Didymodactylos carnosus TaxID=1234261 RepID=A0A8S2DDS9_9BILA|nr:unnamed protein product [Didymodactylos carnosus]CAF3677489.1 unnamed protein product [Didymodactylos carnosus]